MDVGRFRPPGLWRFLWLFFFLSLYLDWLTTGVNLLLFDWLMPFRLFLFLISIIFAYLWYIFSISHLLIGSSILLSHACRVEAQVLMDLLERLNSLPLQWLYSDLCRTLHSDIRGTAVSLGGVPRPVRLFALEESISLVALEKMVSGIETVELSRFIVATALAQVAASRAS